MSDIFDSNETIQRLVKINSVDFVKQVFDFYRQRTVFMIDADGDASNADLIDGAVETVHPDEGGGWFNFTLDPIEDHSPAQIIFSSGTEGRAKAIVLSHAALANVIARINQQMQVDTSIREYIGAPVTYSFGLGRARAIAAVGGHGYIPEDGFNLREIQAMLESDQINAISAVPSLWRVLLNNKELFSSLGKKVKWIEIGSQYMSAEEKRSMKALFPNANILQHYGLTEASRSALLNISSVDEKYLESVGTIKDSGAEIKLNNDHQIQVKGGHTALGRIVDGKLLALVDGDGWLTTSDVGHIEDGYIYYRGRHDDIINCSGIKVDPENLQQKVNLVLQGKHSVAIAGIPNKQRGEGFLVAMNSASFDADKIRNIVNTELLKMSISANDAVIIQHIENIPKTETGKVKRKLLSKQYTPTETSVGKKKTGSPLLGAYQDIFSNQSVSPTSSFESLGGDSLNFVQLSISIEKIIGYLPEDWETKSVGELENCQPATKSFWNDLETTVLLRATAIICIVLAHSGLLEVGGGTSLLFLLVGANFARFQFNEFCDGHIWQVLPKYAIKVIVPYMFLAVVYSIMIDYFDPRVFLLIHNMWSVNWTILFPFWFVQVLVQSLFLMGLMFSIPQLRTALKNNPWLSSYTVLLALVLVRLLYPLVWDTTPQSDMVPLRFIVYIWVGWALYLSEGSMQKLLTMLSGVLFAYYDNGFNNSTAWLTIGCVLLPLISKVRVPKLVKWVASYIAAAIFYVFIFNGPVIYFNKNVLGIDNILLNALCAIVCSIFLWHIFENKNIIGKAIKYSGIRIPYLSAKSEHHE